uniref:Calcium uniporter protein C-terminal domain-containing protein n=1 Tax=Zea mays TaxID=4577 RepID=A0A804LXV8_MAIZE
MAAVLRRAVAQCFASSSSSSPATFGLRRFLQEQPAFRPAVPPDRFMPLADRIRDLGVGVAFPRINLDGLVPPAPAPAPAKREPDAALPAASLTVEEARKVLRATQMEAARARIRESGAGAVVKAIENAIPVRHAAAAAAEIDRAAAARVRRELWCGLTYLVIQTAGFMRLTFWELSWDVMEPICFYVTSMYFMAGYAFFLRTKKEPSFEGFFESRFAAKQKRVMRARGFDLRRYEELRRACGVAAPPLQARTPCASAGAARESGHCHSYCHCH